MFLSDLPKSKAPLLVSLFDINRCCHIIISFSGSFIASCFCLCFRVTHTIIEIESVGVAQGVFPTIDNHSRKFQSSNFGRVALGPALRINAMPPSTCDGQLTGQLVETAYFKKMLPELKRACAKMPFLLCGPPGAVSNFEFGNIRICFLCWFPKEFV